MSTTTIRLPEELKARVDRLAAANGAAAHAFMVEAISEVTSLREQRQEFEAEVERRLQHMQDTGEYLTHDDLRTYVMGLGKREKPVPPAPRIMSPECLERFRASMRRRS